MSETRSNVLLFGSGGVGTIAALNLEKGGLATVTAVLRSNYEAVRQNGFNITSCDHGTLTGWRPSKSSYTKKDPVGLYPLILLLSC